MDWNKERYAIPHNIALAGLPNLRPPHVWIPENANSFTSSPFSGRQGRSGRTHPAAPLVRTQRDWLLGGAWPRRGSRLKPGTKECPGTRRRDERMGKSFKNPKCGNLTSVLCVLDVTREKTERSGVTKTSGMCCQETDKDSPSSHLSLPPLACIFFMLFFILSILPPPPPPALCYFLCSAGSPDPFSAASARFFLPWPRFLSSSPPSCHFSSLLPLVSSSALPSPAPHRLTSAAPSSPYLSKPMSTPGGRSGRAPSCSYSSI